MVGRLVIGLGIGASAIAVPAYLAEIAPAKNRGAVVQVYEVRGRLCLLCVLRMRVRGDSKTSKRSPIHVPDTNPPPPVSPRHQVMLTIGMLAAVLVDAALGSATAGDGGGAGSR